MEEWASIKMDDGTTAKIGISKDGATYFGFGPTPEDAEAVLFVGAEADAVLDFLNRHAESVGLG